MVSAKDRGRGGQTSPNRTIEVLNNKLNLFTWNKIQSIPILPVLHGTDLSIAWKICSNGFATLSSLDVGYYGSGIYFTTSAKYTVSYIATKKHPALILSYLIPGNALPVIEHPHSPNSYMGKVITPGYQSHYVLTTGKGMPLETIKKDGFYDEIVINQESQVCPAYIFELSDGQRFEKIMKEFVREEKREAEEKKRHSKELPKDKVTQEEKA